jgi:hypothetical protein
MRKQLLLGALVTLVVGVAQVHGGIFSRGGGCPNGNCRGGGGYSGYYATNVVTPSYIAGQTAPAQPAVARSAVSQPAVAATPAAPATQAAPQVETSTRATNVSTATSPRGRLFRRWSR